MQRWSIRVWTINLDHRRKTNIARSNSYSSIVHNSPLNILWNVEKRSNETFRMVIYWGRKNLQFHSSIVAPLSHFNAPSTVAVVKMSYTYCDGSAKGDITFPFIACCSLACFQTELLCGCF